MNRPHHRRAHQAAPGCRPGLGWLPLTLVLTLSLVGPLVSAASELDRQWLHGRIDHTTSTIPAFPDGLDHRAGLNLEDRLASLPWNGPPRETIVELHRRLGEVETLKRLWNGQASRPLLTLRPDESGRFRLRTPDAGPWRVVVRAPGFLAMELVPPSVPDVVELGTVWLVPSRDVDLAASLRHSFRRETATAGSGEEAEERIWLASSRADHVALELQRPLHGWSPEPLRGWWSGDVASFAVPHEGTRTVWAVAHPSHRTRPGSGMGPESTVSPTSGGGQPAPTTPPRKMRYVVASDGGGSVAATRADRDAASQATVFATVIANVIATVSIERSDASPGAPPCQGVVLERPLGPLESQFVLGLRVGDRLRVVCPEGTAVVTIPEAAMSADPSNAGRSSVPTVQVAAVVVAPRLPSIRWRLDGTGQSLQRVTLVTGVGHRTRGPGGAGPLEGQARRLGPPPAAIGATTRDATAGWVEVRAPGIAGGRVSAADFVTTANQDAVPAASLSADPGAASASGSAEEPEESGTQIVDAWLRRPSLIEGWVRGDFGDGVPGVDLVALDAAAIARNSVGATDDSAAERGITGRPVWAHTDAEGRFRLRDVPPDRPLLLAVLSPEHPHLVVEERSPAPGSRRQDVRIDLARPLDLVGWVLDDVGAPVPEAEVTLRRFAPVGRLRVVSGVLRGPHHLADQRRFATSDAQGRFVFRDAELGYLSLDVSAPGLASSFVSGLEPDRDHASVRDHRLEIELGTFEMIPERRVELRVVDRDGLPVPGALVSWTAALLPGGTPLRFASRSPYRENPRQPVWHNQNADERGAATLTGIEEGTTVTVLVEAGGFVPHRVDELVIDWSATEVDPVEVMLTPEARIAGRVEGADGTPLQDAYVALHGSDIAVDLGAPSLRTGPGGRFAFDQLPPGDLRITANAVDEAAIDPLDLTLEIGEQRSGLVLRAPPSAPVEGRVADDGVPLEGVSVACCGDLARTDASGVFRIARARLGLHEVEVRLRGRDNHRLQIEVGRSRNWFDIDVARDPDLDRPMRTLRGRLRGSAEVEEQILDGRLAPGMELRSRTSGLGEPVLLSGLGFAALEVPADRYVLTVAAPGARLASVPVDLREGDVTDLVVELQAATDATLRVTVLDADPRSSEGWFRFGLPLLLRSESGMVMNRTARWLTEDDYVLERLSPGRWTLEAETADGLRRATAEVELPADGGEGHALLTFEESERQRITGTLRVDGAPTSGWIMVRAGGGLGGSGNSRFGGVIEQDGSGARPELAMPAASARSNSLGQFEFVAAPGPARLLVSTGSNALGWFDVELIPGVPLSLDLTRSVLVGRVEDEAGGAVAGTTIIARDAGSRAYRGRGTSDANGTFVVEMLTEQGASWPLEVAVEFTQGDPAAWTPVVGDSVVVRRPSSAAAARPESIPP